jgi:hypothetical protein
MKNSGEVSSLLIAMIAASAICFGGTSQAGEGSQCKFAFQPFSLNQLGWGAKVPSPYDTDTMRRRIVDLVRDHEYDAEQLFLNATYEFEGDSDFVLLHYVFPRTRTAGIRFGYVRSSDRLYILQDGFGSSLEEQFNRMVTENPGVPDISPLCKAALLVTLKYRFAPTAIIETPEDVFAAIATFELPTPEIPVDLLGGVGLYMFLPSRDSSLMSWVLPKWQVNPHNSRAEKFAVLLECVGVRPPTINRSASGAAVLLSVYNYQVRGEIARWRVEFDNEGRMVYMWYDEPPLLESCLPGWYKDRKSPFMNRKPFESKGPDR